MILLSETYNIDLDTADEWLAWMKKKYVPLVEATNLTIGFRIFKLLTEIDNGGVTYSCQSYFADLEDCETFHERHLLNLQIAINQAFKGKYVTFQTMLEEA
jgi:Domain of unknown function (DUF4286)